MNQPKLIPEKSWGTRLISTSLAADDLRCLLHRSERLCGDIQQFFLRFNQTIDAALE